MNSEQCSIDEFIDSPGGYQNNKGEFLNFDDDSQSKSEIMNDDFDTQVNKLTDEI